MVPHSHEVQRWKQANRLPMLLLQTLILLLLLVSVFALI